MRLFKRVTIPHAHRRKEPRPQKHTPRPLQIEPTVVEEFSPTSLTRQNVLHSSQSYKGLPSPVIAPPLEVQAPMPRQLATPASPPTTSRNRPDLKRKHVSAHGLASDKKSKRGAHTPSPNNKRPRALKHRYTAPNISTKSATVHFTPPEREPNTPPGDSAKGYFEISEPFNRRSVAEHTLHVHIGDTPKRDTPKRDTVKDASDGSDQGDGSRLELVRRPTPSPLPSPLPTSMHPSGGTMFQRGKQRLKARFSRSSFFDSPVPSPNVKTSLHSSSGNGSTPRGRGVVNYQTYSQ